MELRLGDIPLYRFAEFQLPITGDVFEHVFSARPVWELGLCRKPEFAML